MYADDKREFGVFLVQSVSGNLQFFTSSFPPAELLRLIVEGLYFQIKSMSIALFISP